MTRLPLAAGCVVETDRLQVRGEKRPCIHCQNAVNLISVCSCTEQAVQTILGQPEEGFTI